MNFAKVPTFRSEAWRRAVGNRFIASYEEADQGCLIWTKCLREGYGRYWNSELKRLESAHVWSYRGAFGDVPSGKQINHKCNNRSCVNPDHLYAGTQVENMRDMKDAGREKKRVGSMCHQAKLTVDQVLLIRNYVGNKAALARALGVSPSLIQFVQRGKIWKHV